MTTETDRELLELAAKAAGIEYRRDIDGEVIEYCGGGLCIAKYGEKWNPLTDSGDALELAVKLNLQINPTVQTHYGPASTAYDGGVGISTIQHGGDASMATREAIVRAAAEIGRAMP